MKRTAIYNIAIALPIGLTSLTMLSACRDDDGERETDMQQLLQSVDSISKGVDRLTEQVTHEIASKRNEAEPCLAGDLPSCKDNGGKMENDMQQLLQSVDSISKGVDRLTEQVAQEIASTRKEAELFSAEDYHKDAQIAFDMARQAEDSNDAFIYCMNALQKDARNYDYYTFMSDLAEKESDIVILEQIERIMELGLYQVPADKVVPLSALLKNVQNRTGKQEIEENTDPSHQAVEERDIVTQLQSSWNEIETCNDAKQVSKLCSDRLELLQELAGDGNDYNEEMEKTVARASFVTLVSTIRSAIDSTKASLTDFNKVPETSLSSWDIAMQGINGQLTQLCMLVVTTKPEWLPIEASAQKDNLCAEVEACRILLGKAKSIPVRKLIEQVKRDEKCSDAEVCAVEKIYKDANTGQRGDITKEIDRLVIKMRKLTLLISRLEDKEYARECATYLADINNSIAKKQKERMKAYQIWALTKCNDARKCASKETNKEGMSAAHAAIQYHLRWVDISLLAPETADIYQTVLSTYKREAEESEKITIEQEIVKTEKHALERM